MKKTKKDFEKWAIKVAEVYMERFGLSLMEVKLNNNNSVEFLEVGSRYPYKDIVYIQYNDSAYNEWLKGTLSKYFIVHEILHTLTDPLYCKAKQRFVSETEIEDEREILTDTLMTIIRAYDKLIK